MVDVSTSGNDQCIDHGIDAVMCREIVRKIIDVDVDDRCIMMIIRLLALEIENRDVMLAVCKAIDTVSLRT